MIGDSNAIVEAHDLRKTYKPDVRALDGLSFSVAAGSVFALLGPNGAGKTTTVRILTTLSRPDEGTATVAGIDVLSRPRLVRSQIGSVSQHSGAVSLLTGQENLSMQGRLYGMRGEGLRRRVNDLLDQFGLAEAAKRQARTYSGGMRRRLDIATVLVHRPAVLFLDEPTTGLDPEGRADLWAVLTGLAKTGTTILVTTHYLEEADQYATRIAIVDQGRIVAEGTADELKAGLHGDSVLLELADARSAEQAERAVAGIPQVGRVTADGSVLRARVPEDGARTLPTVLAAVDAAGVPVLSVSVSRPSLDDVYLHHAGRSFGRAERIKAA